MAKVTFIGLGVMGYPMAGHLARAGHDVTVYNRTGAKAEQWVKEYGGQAAPTPAQASQNADFVFSCVGNDDDLRQVTLGSNGAFTAMKAGAIFIDHTTTSATVARELQAEAIKRGFDYLDAPVSGGQIGAEKGILTIMVGGTEDAFVKAEPLFRVFSKELQHMGPSGNGQLTKMVNQICIASVLQGLSEALSLAQASKLDIDKVVTAVGAGSGSSWQLLNRSHTMVADKFDFGFAVDWIRKDLGICLEEARRNGTSLPVTAIIDQFYADVQKMGGGRWDASSLIKRFKQS